MTTMTTQHNRHRVETTDFLTFSNYDVDRIIHVMRLGAAQLAKDVQTFKNAYVAQDEAGDRQGAKAMLDMAELFGSYITEAYALIEKLGNASYQGARLAFVDHDGISALSGAVAEDLGVEG